MGNVIIGRKKELELLDKIMASEKAEFLAVYGRRRVGKTFLIYEYLQSHFVFSFSGAFEKSKSVQLGNFFREYLRFTKGNKETAPPKDWGTAFSYLTDYLYEKQKQSDQKLVVFIDEMPWLDTPRSGFVAALEYFWNQHVSKMDQVVLIACGSTASWIKKKLLKSKGGLYNRVTRRIKLDPFNLHQTAAFCRAKNFKFSQYQIIQLYMVMGGIPFYLNELSGGKSVIQLINEICFSPTGLLTDEYEQLYYSLFKHAENHVAVIEALSEHPYGLTRKDLLKKSKLPDGGTFNRTLNDLLESGFILKYLPFQKKQKQSIYRLIDLYSLFYLRFIKGNNAQLQNSWQMLSKAPKYVAWSGYAYENICLLHIPQILKKLGISGTITQTSSWHHKGNDEIPGAQIDLLIDRNDGVINLCEAKFSNKEYIITKEYAAKLRRKRAVFEHLTKTKKSVVTSLISTYPAIQNSHYLSEIHSEVTMEDLFEV
ncbi:MAG: ATP-binding protein [Bacteroidota bacterium]